MPFAHLLPLVIASVILLASYFAYKWQRDGFIPLIAGRSPWIRSLRAYDAEYYPALAYEPTDMTA